MVFSGHSRIWGGGGGGGGVSSLVGSCAFSPFYQFGIMTLLSLLLLLLSACSMTSGQ